jgi:stage II sporulation protein D
VSRLAGASRKVRSVRLDSDRASGRVKYLHFETGAGKVRVHGMDFRSGMGLKSQNFTMTIRNKTVTISGRGWGHGSGMCQDGAVGMARAGVDYRRILSHYYGGVTLKRVY